jgi:putative peptidoglycan lipid II flippase
VAPARGRDGFAPVTPASLEGDQAGTVPLLVPGPHRAVARAAAVVGAATLASRILGFARDLVVARAFGAGPVTDAFFVAFRLPNLLRRLVAEGALSSAFIPVFTDYLTTRPRREAHEVFRKVTGAMLVMLGSLSLLGALAAPGIVRVMAPGFFADPALGALTVRLTRVMFPYLFPVGLAALAMGILNAHRHFLLPALSPTALSVGIIAGALWLAPRLAEPAMGLAVGVLVGGAGQLLIQVPALVARGTIGPPALDFRHPAVRRIATLMGPVLVGQSALQVGTLINTIIASFLAGGSVSYLYYADRLVEFPLGIFGIAVATAVLPTLSEQAARRDSRALRETVSFALRLATFVSLPAAIGLLVLSQPIVRVLYQHGRFGSAETAGTAAALAVYAAGLVGFTISKIGAQAFYALGDTRTPVAVSIAGMALNCALAAALARPLGHVGLALATSVSAVASGFALAGLLRRRLPGPPVPGARAAWVRIVAVSTGLGVLLFGIGHLAPAPAGRLTEGVWLASVIILAAGGYLTTHVLLRSDEARLATDFLGRRWRRSSLRRPEPR